MTEIDREILISEDQERIDAYYKAQLSKELSISEDKINGEELIRLFNFMRGKITAFDGTLLKQKYLSNLSALDNSGGLTKTQYLIDAWLVNEIGNMSYGSSLPFYQSVLQGIIHNPQTGPHQALLVGAMNSFSMREFTKGVHSVFPDANCLTIDLNATDKDGLNLQNSEFQVMDALEMPFREKFDSIHTTGLLDFLQDPTLRSNRESPNLAKRRRRFFSRSKRALKPGGTLVMAERPIAHSLPSDKQPYLKELKELGFTDITVHTVTGFKNRRLLDYYMLGDSNEIPAEFTVDAAKTIGITATAH